jgi:hypothetical protein
VIGDLDYEENRDGISGYDLWAGLTGCNGGIDECPRVRMKRDFSVAFLFLSPAKPKSRGSEIRLPRRPSRTPIGLGRSAPRFDRSGPCIVKFKQQFHFAFLTSGFICRFGFLDYKIFLLLLLRRGDCDNYCGCFQFLTSEEHRHILRIGVSIGVHGRRVPGPTVLLSVLDGRVLMAVTQQSVKFADIVVIQFQISNVKKFLTRKSSENHQLKRKNM